MTITLRPEHEQWIAEAMGRGAYQNPDEVVACALEMLQSEDEWLQEQKGRVEEKLERAFAQFESGQFLSAEESRADMEKRKADWLAEQNR
jgi:Arc/MetJ-type ribon-helix-helix transcriptional regulator